jgi:hypothetical protein
LIGEIEDQTYVLLIENHLQRTRPYFIFEAVFRLKTLVCGIFKGFLKLVSAFVSAAVLRSPSNFDQSRKENILFNLFKKSAPTDQISTFGFGFR